MKEAATKSPVVTAAALTARRGQLEASGLAIRRLYRGLWPDGFVVVGSGRTAS